jgi:hypothetical protein
MTTRANNFSSVSASQADFSWKGHDVLAIRPTKESSHGARDIGIDPPHSGG